MPTLRIAKTSEHARPSQHMALGKMADREMAIAIGDHIIGLQRDLATFIEDGIAADHRKRITNKIARDDDFSKQRHRFLRAVGSATNSSSLIRVLHRVFLEEEKSSAAAD